MVLSALSAQNIVNIKDISLITGIQKYLEQW